MYSAKSPTSLIVVAVFGLLGLAAIVFGVRSLLESRASTAWPTVDGVVIENRMETSVKGNSPVPYYSPVVIYEYGVDGRSYRSDRWSFSGSLQTSDKAEADAVLRRSAPGRSVKVHYDPTDPTIAVLTPGGGRFGWGLIGFGGLFIALGLLVGLSRRRTRRTEAEISG